jgi:hypothetical protein
LPWIHAFFRPQIVKSTLIYPATLISFAPLREVGHAYLFAMAIVSARAAWIVFEFTIVFIK